MDSYYDRTSLNEAVARAAAEGVTLYTAGDVAGYELCGILPARPIGARALAYATQATSTGAEQAALIAVAFSTSDAQLAVARENARLVRLALLAAE